MKKREIIILMMFLVLCVSGCGQIGENTVDKVAPYGVYDIKQNEGFNHHRNPIG